MDRFRKFMMTFGPIIGIILLCFVVFYAVLAFQEDKSVLDEVSPATMDEVLADPAILQSLEEPMGEVAASEALTETASVEEAGELSETEALTETASVEETDEISATEAITETSTSTMGGSDAEPAEIHQTSILDDWTLQAMYDENGELVGLVPETEIRASFAGGALSGSTTCSNYVGKYEADDEGTITIELIATSPLEDAPDSCADNGPAAEQETAYLDALQSAASYGVKQAQLELSNEDGEIVLRFNVERK